jgi:hypothetical protein
MEKLLKTDQGFIIENDLLCFYTGVFNTHEITQIYVYRNFLQKVPTQPLTVIKMLMVDKIKHIYI